MVLRGRLSNLPDPLYELVTELDVFDPAPKKVKAEEMS